jgi:hypothetical protein
MMQPVHLAVAFVRACDGMNVAMPHKAVKPYSALLLMPNWDDAEEAKELLSDIISAISVYEMNEDGITAPLTDDENMSNWAFAAGAYIQQM